MRRNGLGEQERNLLLGTTPKWPWLAPYPISGNPALVWQLIAGDEVPDPDLAVIRAADTIDGIEPDGRTLTKAAGDIMLGQGIQGTTWGQAFLITAAGGYFPVQVERIEADQIILADPLPVTPVISGAAPATLAWRWYLCTVPGEVSETQTGASPIRWTVTYTAAPGTAVGVLGEQRYQGLVHVVEAIFDPGVDHSSILSFPSPHVDQLRHRHHSWDHAIGVAHRELVTWLRTQLQTTTTGRREGDLVGQEFHPAALRLTLAVLLEATAPEESKRQRELAFQLAEQALRSTSWYDPDGDGVPDSEAPAMSGADLAGGNFTPARNQATCPTFYSGRPH